MGFEQLELVATLSNTKLAAGFDCAPSNCTTLPQYNFYPEQVYKVFSVLFEEARLRANGKDWYLIFLTIYGRISHSRPGNHSSKFLAKAAPTSHQYKPRTS